MDQPLWTPSADRVARREPDALHRAGRPRHRPAVKDYPSLYGFSIERPLDFWRCGLDFTRDHRRPRRARGGRSRSHAWRALLSRRPAELRREPAAAQRRRARRSSFMARRGGSAASDARRRCAAGRALRARRCAAGRGRRATGSPAILPNIPETVVAALGTAAIGAVWSSCSPDFGVQGVLDRFGQIAPVVLVAADGYAYAGKSHDCMRAAGRDRSARCRACGRWSSCPYVERASGARRRSRTACDGTSSSRFGAQTRSRFERLPVRPPALHPVSRRARPAYPSASCTAPAARCCST